MSPTPRVAARGGNPIWMISSFLGLTEISFTIAAMKTAGALQWAFAIFGMGFAAIIVTSFVLILVKYNHVLYSPTDSAGEATVEEYIDAMRSAKMEMVPKDELRASLRPPQVDTRSVLGLMPQ